MKLGSYEVPEIRLMPQSVEVLESIYRIKHRERVPAKGLALLLGYKYGTEPHFYRKIHSLTTYGLLEGKGTYQVSDLGESLLHPRNDTIKEISLTKAVLNVGLWKEIYNKHGKIPRQDNFWAILMDITKIEPDKAKELDSKMYKWYTEDIAHVTDNLVGQDSPSLGEQGESKGLSSNNGNNNQMSQSMANQDPSKMQTILFDKYQISLPKGDLVKEWEKLKKYMELKLEDYKSEQQEELTKEE